MKRILPVLFLAIGAVSAWAIESPRVGKIDYIEGSVTVSRVGRTLGDLNIDDPLLSGDLIRTAGDGLLVIAMDKATGMSGTITIHSKASLYLRLDQVKGEPRTSVDVLAGSIGSKVAKLSGSPGMVVASSNAVMGVRGTDFVFAISIKEATLVICAEGKVSVSDGKADVQVPAGKVLEKRPGEAPAFVPVALSTLKEYRERWIADEIEAFKVDAPRALADYARRYDDLAAKFAAAYDPFQRSATLRKWFEDDRTGAKINPLDAAVMREKKEMAGYLLNLRKILFVFERIYYRVDELSDIIVGTPYERQEIRKGLTAGDFLRRVAGERDQYARQVARFRYAEQLYKARDPESSVFGSGDEDFFQSGDGF